MTFAVVHLSGVASRERTALKTPASPCTGGRRDRAGECGTVPHHGAHKSGGHVNMCPPFGMTEQARG